MFLYFFKKSESKGVVMCMTWNYHIYDMSSAQIVWPQFDV